MKATALANRAEINMRTIDNQFVQHETWWSRTARDLRLLARLAMMTIDYFIAGRRVRREYRAREARGEVYWVDDESSTA